jgi:hypothetical protein
MIYKQLPKRLNEDDPTWTLFKTKDFWRPFDIPWILNGYLPPVYSKKYKTFERILIETSYDMIDSTAKALLETLVVVGIAKNVHLYNDGSSYHAWFEPFNVLEWAKGKGFKIPSPLSYAHDQNLGKFYWIEKREMQKSKSNNIIHIDMGSSNLSEELKIALQAWNALYNSDEFNHKLGHHNNIKKWLKDNHPDLSGAAIKRISIVVNINKKGGATPTE